MPVAKKIRASATTDIPAINNLLAVCFPNRKVVFADADCLVIEEAGSIAACAMFRITADECEIIDICVNPEFRRKGLAEKLLEELLSKGAAKIFLEVEQDNLPAIRLYEKHGFRRIGFRKNYYRYLDGRTADALVMGKDT